MKVRQLFNLALCQADAGKAGDDTAAKTAAKALELASKAGLKAIKASWVTAPDECWQRISASARLAPGTPHAAPAPL